jgi:peptidoglycan-N-acetylglucosamine deacetylase
MRTFLIKTPWWLHALFPKRIWHMDRSERNIYLTFDDGPHPVATPFVLDQLKKYNARATFFCIGKNVEAYPEIYERIKREGHAVGNHTQDHLNGWETDTTTYLENIAAAGKSIESGLFRPPYGRVRSAQARKLSHFRIIMWDVLSGDFDKSVTTENCFENVTRHTNNGSIVVFHDSEKAWSKMSNTLPLVLEHFSKKGFKFSAILGGKNDRLP